MNIPIGLRPFGHRSFRIATTALVSSFSGNALYLAAVPFGFIALGGSALEVGTGAGIATLTQIVFLLVGGAIVDRVTSRTVLVVADVVRALSLGATALLGFGGRLEIWHLYVQAAVFGGTAAFSIPAITAIMPTLVPAEILVQGNVVRALSRQGSRAIGSLLAGFIVAVSSVPYAFAASAALLLLGPLLILRLPRVVAERAARTHLASEIGEGLRFIAGVPWLWLTIVGFALVNTALFAPVLVALPFLVRDVMLADARMYGTILAASSVGQLVGGLALASFRPRRAATVMWLAAAASGLAVAGFGLLPSVGAVVLLATLDGVGFVTFVVVKDSLLQRKVPTPLLGRVASVDSLGAVALGPATPIVGALTDLFGPRAIFVGGGVSAIVLSSVLAVLPWIRAVELGSAASPPSTARRDELG